MIPYPNFKLENENGITDTELIQDMANKYFALCCQPEDVKTFRANIDSICMQLTERAELKGKLSNQYEIATHKITILSKQLAEAKDKVSRRNMQIKELKSKISNLIALLDCRDTCSTSEIDNGLEQARTNL